MARAVVGSVLERNPAPAVDPITPEGPSAIAATVLRQRWAELAYFHWRYPASTVQDLLPTGLKVDVFDGSAWVGLIPFEMQSVRLARGPRIPWVGDFIEVNVRTYVVDGNGRRSVWFFSLDVPRAVVVGVARSVFGLPYCWADAHHDVDGDRHRYRVRRRRPHGARGAADMRFSVLDRIPDEAVSDLDHFLTARWALSAERSGLVRRGRVDHPRWPLHEVGEVEIVSNLLEVAGLPSPAGVPHARYSPGVDVRVAWFEPLGEP